MSASAPIPDVRSRRGEERAHADAARNMFDRIAPTYDALNRVLSAGIDSRWRSRAVAELRGVAPGSILDLCAGTLDLSALLERERPRDRIVALDFSAAMLDAGRRKAPRTEVIVGDATALPFADGEFAAVVCGFGMRNLSDTARGIREVLRVLRPGGRFVTLELFRPTRLATRAFHGAYAGVLLPTLGGLVSGDGGAYRYLVRSMARFYSRVEYQKLLEACGFSLVHGADLTLGIASVVRAERPR